MAARSWDRRRVAVSLVALVGAVSTIATSPAYVRSQLDRAASATVVLDDSTPRAIGRFVLTLSPEALPVETTAGPRPSGAASFAVGSTTGGGGAGAGSGRPIAISASAVGIPEPPRTASGGPSWPIEELCRLAEPCRREFDVSVEWLQPQPGTSVTVSVQASLSIVYDRWPSLPGGASAAWETGEFTTVAPAPALSARADLGKLTLGRDAPFAARHVLLTGSAAVLADPTGADITAYVRSDLSGDRPLRAVVTILPDGPLAPEPIFAGAFFQPFAGCPRARDCVRGFTIVARWTGLEPNGRVDLDWSFEAIARFPADQGIPDDAKLRAEVDDKLDLGPASPRLHAQAVGALDLLPSGGRTRGNVRLTVSAPALRHAFFGTDVPAIAVVRLCATLKDPTPSAGLRAWVAAPDQAAVTYLVVPDDGSELQTVVLPLARCREDTGRCIGFIEITVESTAGREGTIDWQVAIDLPVPRSELAVGELRIEVADAP